jgi:hypothetical protein
MQGIRRVDRLRPAAETRTVFPAGRHSLLIERRRGSHTAPRSCPPQGTAYGPAVHGRDEIVLQRWATIGARITSWSAPH